MVLVEVGVGMKISTETLIVILSTLFTGLLEKPQVNWNFH